MSSLLARTLFVPLSPTKEQVFDLLLLLALSPLALPGGSVCFGGLMVIPFTWAFMRWPYTHGGSLAALPVVGLLGKGCWRIVRVPQNLLPHPSPGREVNASVFGITVRTLLQAAPLTRSQGIFPYARPGFVRLCLYGLQLCPSGFLVLKCRDLAFS